MSLQAGSKNLNIVTKHYNNVYTFTSEQKCHVAWYEVLYIDNETQTEKTRYKTQIKSQNISIE